jgi:hypothetical protein
MLTKSRASDMMDLLSVLRVIPKCSKYIRKVTVTKHGIGDPIVSITVLPLLTRNCNSRTAMCFIMNLRKSELMFICDKRNTWSIMAYELHR